jgi:hypothetical protein
MNSYGKTWHTWHTGRHIDPEPAPPSPSAINAHVVLPQRGVNLLKGRFPGTAEEPPPGVREGGPPYPAA